MNTENSNPLEIAIQYIDIEEYAKSGKEPPKGQKYLIKIDKSLYKVDQECMTGKEILEVADKTPAERFQLNIKLKGGEVKKVGYHETICFSKPGIERFMTIPLDQTEGQK
jgi:hypothetical protein